MNPRPYQLGKRQAQIEESRQRVIDAARELLAEASSYSSFTVEAVANRADVARATVYYQFETKTGLIEALCDALAEDGQMSDLASAFMEPDPIEGLSRFVDCFARFWDVDRLVMRRLRSLAELEHEVGSVIAARDEGRRSGLSVLVTRLNDFGLLAIEPERALRMLYCITSFETFDVLATEDQPLTEIAPDVITMAGVVWRRQVAASTTASP